MSAAQAVARFGVGVVVRVLPTWQDRARYRAEFLAELAGMPAPAQLRHTAGLLSQAFALRAALGASPSRVQEDPMRAVPAMRFSLLCAIAGMHEYRVVDEGSDPRLMRCKRCGKQLPLERLNEQRAPWAPG